MAIRDRLRRAAVHRLYMADSRHFSLASAEEREGDVVEALLSKRPFCLARVGLTEAAGMLSAWGGRWVERRSFGPGGLAGALLTDNGLFVRYVEAPDLDVVTEYARVQKHAIAAADLICVYFNFWEWRVLRRSALSGGARLRLTNSDLIYGFLREKSWMNALRGMTVLVVSPFVRTIQTQIPKLHRIWGRFGEQLQSNQFELLACPFTPAVQRQEAFENWAQSLLALEDKVRSATFDVLLAGAGAYANALARVAKEKRAAGFNLGGAVSPLFGIRTRRYDKQLRDRSVVNEHWIRPLPCETPAGAHLVEGGCFW